MSPLALSDLSKKLQQIDFCMMTTKSPEGVMSNRPMSNNGDVEYDGDSWFFSYEETGKISHIGRHPDVTLSFTEPPSLLGEPGIFISIEGKASVIRERDRFDEHWIDGLERWFPEGVETPGLVLINVHADRIQYWDGEEHGAVEI